MNSMKKLLTSSLALLSLGASAQAATLIEVRADVTGPVGLAPFIVGFSDGSFDIFDTGSAASAALETLAETGAPSGFAPPSGGALLGPGVGPGSPPIFAPGAMASTIFSVADGDGMLNLAAMLLPSNDWFIGNGNALDVSSLLGAANGTTLSFDFINVYDAGTELEDFAAAPGNGLIGIDTPGSGAPGVGTDQGGTVSLLSEADPFSIFANTSPGTFDSSAFNFNGGPIASVTLTVVPEPSVALLGLIGAVALAGSRRRRS